MTPKHPSILFGLIILVSACTSDAFEPISAPADLVAPTHQMVTDAAFIHFEWHEVPEAQRYQLVIDNEPVLITRETSATVNLQPRAQAYCWQVLAQARLMQYPSVTHCLQVLAPEICVDDSYALSWPPLTEAESYRILVEHEATGATHLSTVSEPQLRLQPTLPPGELTWTVIAMEAHGGETEIGVGSLIRHPRESISSLRVIVDENDGQAHATWEGTGPFELELFRGSCEALGSRITGWPRTEGENEIWIDDEALLEETDVSLSVRSVAQACPGEAVCQSWTLLTDSNQACNRDIGTLTWRDVTPENYIAPHAWEEPGIVYDESVSAFLMIHAAVAQKLEVQPNLEVVATEIDAMSGLAFGSAKHVEGALVYDPVTEENLIFSAGSMDTDTHALDLKSGQPWRTFIQPNGESPSFVNDHAALIDPLERRMLVYGGSTDAKLWSMDLTTQPPVWTEISASGSLPIEKWAFIPWYDSVNHRMLIFGGISFVTSLGLSNRTHALDLATLSWETINTSGTPPSPRAEYGGVQFGCYFLVTHGFLDDVEHAADTHVLVNNQEWVQPTVDGDIPRPDWGFDAAWDPVNRVVLIVGGLHIENQSRVLMLEGF